MSESKRFLFATWDGGGNVPPLLGVARRLVARGHQVRVLADPTVEREARGAGCDFSPWTTAPHRTTRDRSADILKDYEAGSPLQMIEAYMRDFLAAPAPRWAADTLAVLEAHPVDAFVTEQLLPATTIAAQKLGIPTAALSPNIWMIPTRGLPPLGPGFKPARGPFGRLRDAAFRALQGRLFDKALPSINAVRTSYGLDPIDSTYGQILSADRTFILTTPAFDFTTPHLQKNVYYAGPILDDPAWSVPWTSPWPASDTRPLVLVSLSSTYQNQVAVLKRIVEALSRLPVRALVTLGEAISASEVSGSENVVVVPSAPHSQILPHAALLVTHCGHGTTIKGLNAGVPLVCIPMGRDQNDTATRVEVRGAGVQVSPKASTEKIHAAISKVLADPSYREAARRIASAIAANEGCVDVVASLEELAGSRSAARREASVAAVSPARTSAANAV